MDIFLATFVLFALCMAGLSVGLVLSKKGLKKGCCSGACETKKRDLCPGSENFGHIIKTATIAAPNRHHH